MESKKYSQDDLIPIIILLIGGNGGKAPVKYVEENMYELEPFRDEFKKDVYQEKVANGTPHWKQEIAWARERAKTIRGES